MSLIPSAPFPICGNRRQCARCNREKIRLRRSSLRSRFGGVGGYGGTSVVVQAPTALKSAVTQRCYSGFCVTAESIQIQGPCIHRGGTIGIVRPFLFRTIPVKLQPVLIGIAEVKRFTHSVITRAFEWNLGCEQPAERVAEPRSIGIKNSNVKQTGAAGRRWRKPPRLPTCSVRCDDDIPQQTQTLRLSPSVASAQTRARRSKIQASVPDQRLLDVRDRSALVGQSVRTFFRCDHQKS